ncbi:G-protein coupled receptor family C group 6 member A-like [Alosa pseudoharengus]|uniref:G-protein coupled receptor family C group 6 member A-like n=1 Tax=Alosa pseudoharengus TaxID=34774 RepID=UPI003F892582
MWLHLLGLVLCAALVQISQTEGKGSQCKDTDKEVIIGILNSVHSTVDNLQGRDRPGEFICSNIDLTSFIKRLAAIYTIERVNDSEFLPGVCIGYVLCDPCADSTKAIHCGEHMLSEKGCLPVMDDYSEFRPKVKVILGERYSLTSIPVAKLQLYTVPISTTASAAVLSDKLQFPGFFRVSPSDAHQTNALAALIRSFGWNWVGLISMDDEYGRGVHQSFLKSAEEAGVCVAFEEVIPHYLNQGSGTFFAWRATFTNLPKRRLQEKV